MSKNNLPMCFIYKDTILKQKVNTNLINSIDKIETLW